MHGLAFREPISTVTHLAWMLLAVPALWPLWRAAGRNPVKRRGAMVYGFSLIFCFAGSSLYHSVPPAYAPFFRTMDHVGIFLLIAGTVTPIGLIVLDGWWRRGLVGGIWLLAFAGISLRVSAYQDLRVMTAFYLFMGWIGLAMYPELARRLTHAGIRPLWIGGIFYTVGAVINTLAGQATASRTFGAHEVFHLFVMAGSAWHYGFILCVVLPYAGRRKERPVVEPVPLLALAPVVVTRSVGVEHAEDRVAVVE